MRGDLPKLVWSKEISERVEIDAKETVPTHLPFLFPRPGGPPPDLDTCAKDIRGGRRSVPITDPMSDESVRFWFLAATDTSVAVDDVVDAAVANDLSKPIALKQVEERFRALCAANRWDIPQPPVVSRLLPRLVSWDDTVRLILEHPRPHTINAMLAVLPFPKDCGASKEIADRGQARLRDFVDSRETQGSWEVGQALRFLNYPEGVARFFKGSTKRYAKRIARDLGGPLLVQLKDGKAAYTATKRFGIPLPAARIRDLVERFGYEHADLLVAAAAKNNAELKLMMAVHTPHAVAGWLGLLKKAALVDFAEHYLLNEGANAIEGLIKTVGRRGQLRDHALGFLVRIVDAGHEKLVRELMSDETKKIQELIEAHVFAEDEDALPELPDEDWPAWLTKLVEGAPAKLPPTLKAVVPSQLPELRTSDGAYRIPTRAVEALLAKLASAVPKTPPVLKQAAEAWHPDDQAAFASLFFARWFAGKKPLDPNNVWILSLVELFGSELEAAQLGTTLTSSKWGRSLRPKAMTTLRRMETREALSALERLRFKYAKSKKLLEELEQKWGCSHEEFLDRIVPTCGLNELHCLELDFGERKPIAAVLPPDRIVIVDRDSGDVFQKLPPRRKVDDNDLYKVAREQYKALRKSHGKVSEEQIPRFERAMINDRRFKKDHWLEFLSLHAVLGPIVCTLVWKTLRDGEWVLFLPTHPDDTCIDLNYDEVQLGEEVALAHPADMTPEEARRWSELLAENEIVQPFDQLARLAFRKGSPDIEQELARLKREVKTGHDLKTWLQQRRWHMGQHVEGLVSHFLSVPVDAWQGLVTVDPPIQPWNWPPSGEHSITGVSFTRAGVEVEAAEVPAVIYSECLRSLFQ